MVSKNYYLLEKRARYENKTYIVSRPVILAEAIQAGQKSITTILNIKQVGAIASENHITNTNSSNLLPLDFTPIKFWIIEILLFTLAFLEAMDKLLVKLTGGCEFSSHMHCVFRQLALYEYFFERTFDVVHGFFLKELPWTDLFCICQAPAP